MLLLFSFFCWGLALVARGQSSEPSPSPSPEPLPTPETSDGGPVYSSDLDTIFTPCRSVRTRPQNFKVDTLVFTKLNIISLQSGYA